MRHLRGGFNQVILLLEGFSTPRIWPSSRTRLGSRIHVAACLLTPVRQGYADVWPNNSGMNRLVAPAGGARAEQLRRYRAVRYHPDDAFR
jgi:hypothetical protein